jgi:hypothetical protein
MPIELVYRFAILVVVRRFPSTVVVDFRSLRLDIDVIMKEFACRSIHAPYFPPVLRRYASGVRTTDFRGSA